MGYIILHRENLVMVNKWSQNCYRVVENHVSIPTLHEKHNYTLQLLELDLCQIEKTEDRLILRELKSYAIRIN